MDTYPMKVIARARSAFPTKFGIPRQAGLVDGLITKIVFEPLYRNPDAFREIEGYSHLWLIWCFSESVREDWSPTVRPPRLGGNRRVGVFATRSPFRPNPLGLSAVKLERVGTEDPEGPVLYVSGADLMDGTPIFDVKPYLPFTDSRPEASEGFAGPVRDRSLPVEIPDGLLREIPESLREPLREVLAQDPRPSYQQDPERTYGFDFAGMQIGFRVAGGRLTVTRVSRRD